VIVAEHLSKSFRRYRRAPGLRGSVATLLTRQYDLIEAVHDVSFEVRRGARLAYLGPNGAGKSTTIKLLTGIMRPTAGHARVAGIDPHEHRTRAVRHMGVVFGQRSQLWWDLPVADSFAILRHLYDVQPAVFARNMSLFRRLLDIDALGNTPVRQLSLGQRMRAEVAACLIHDPAVIFLDEPTIGLDLLLKEGVHELINHVNTELGTTVMLTSHDIGDIVGICDQALVVDRGHVVHEGTLRQLIRSVTTRVVVVECAPGSFTPQESAARVQAALPGVQATTDDGRIRVEYPSATMTAREVIMFLLDHLDVVDVLVPDMDLETVLRRIYAGHAASTNQDALA